ncbi:MAG: AhpC/TSA antioxidant enzyme, partial [Thermoleophilia bacterium]|nr:AhpC/TSA antioxidant enzyme [Thermoleophilia bacterium]
ELGAHYAGLPTEFVVVADADQSLYDAFGTLRLERARDLRVRARNLLTTGLRHVLRGGRLKRPGQDLLQLGGDAVVDADGQVAWLHRAARPDDRVPVDELATHMHRAA